jgi:hypothetical protein
MAGAEFTSWKLSAEERRRAVFTGIESVAVLLGPWASFAALGLEYLYNRRNLIFNNAGEPLQAFDGGGRALPLSSLAQRPAAPAVPLYLNPELTASARQLGLRSGDPVTLILSDSTTTRSRESLIVPTSVGQPVSLAVPRGTYSLAAFGARRDTLFATPDPFTTIDAHSFSVTGQSALALPLAARQTLYTPTYQPPQTVPPTCNCDACVASRSYPGCTCDLCMSRRAQAPPRYTARPTYTAPPRPETLWEKINRHVDDFLS